MATEADLIQKFKDLDIPVGADFEELIHAAFASSNLADQINSKADDSKVVHTADMRKPANQVASIDEVNAKQDKIGYTPADDSKVVHDNKNGTISVNGASIFPANENVIGRIDGAYTDMNDVPMGWWYLNGWTGISGLANWGLPQGFYYVHCFKTRVGISANIQIAYNVSLNSTYVRTISGTNWKTWKLLADDSKVAHLSGANNFDTVPTVNNNPLLLASSLPSDLARTSQQTNFTSGLKSGGVDVATAADLKSVADKAWYKLDNKYITSTYIVSSASTVLYKIDDTNKRLYLQGSIILTSNVTAVAAITLNLGSIVKNVLTFNGSYLGYAPGWQNWTNMNTSAGLTFSPQFGLVQFSGDKANAWESTGPLYVTYDELV